MNNNFILFTSIGLSIYLATMVIIGWIVGRSRSHTNFIIGGRKVGILATAASIGAGWRDIAFMTFWLSISYNSGWGAYTVFIGSILSLLLIAWRGVVFRHQAKKRGFITPSQLIDDHIGPFSEKTYTYILLFNCVILGAAQFFVMGNLLGAVLDINPVISVLLIACIVAFYLWRGGYGSVIITDIVQFCLILALISLPFLIETKNTTEIFDISSFGSLGWAETLALIIFPFFWNIPSPDIWQRLFSAKNDRVVKIGIPLGAVFATALTFSLVYLGISLRAYLPDADPDNLFILIFTEEVFSTGVLSLILVSIFAMGMSTIDTWCYAFSSTVMKNVFKTETLGNRSQYIWKNRVLMIAYLAIVCCFALISDNLMHLLMGIISAYAITAPLFYVVLFNLLPKSKHHDGVLTILTLLSFGLFLYMHFFDLFSTSFVLSLIPVATGFLAIMGYCLYIRLKNAA